jgi:flagellar biosynthesis protein FlhA
VLTEYCRQKLARTITKAILGPGVKDLQVLTLDPAVEDIITAGIQQTEHGAFLSVEPDKVQAVLAGVNAEMDKFAKLSQPPVILCSPVVRRHLRRMVERFLPNLAVLSHNELAPELNVHALGVVKPTVPAEQG